MPPIPKPAPNGARPPKAASRPPLPPEVLRALRPADAEDTDDTRPYDDAHILAYRATHSFESDADMLRRLRVTYDDPVSIVQPGEVYVLNERHKLVIADPVFEVRLWLPHIRDDMVFCPYAGPLIAVTNQYHKEPMLIVQPDPFIAGRILDHFKAIAGEAEVRRA